jgi:hypothetical protein
VTGFCLLRAQSSAVEDLHQGNFQLPGAMGAVFHPVGKWTAVVILSEFLYKPCIASVEILNN